MEAWSVGANDLASSRLGPGLGCFIEGVVGNISKSLIT